MSTSIGRSVCLLVCHSREPCKNGWTDRYAIGLWARLGSRNHVLVNALDPPWDWAIFRGRRGIVKYRDALRWAVQNGWTDRDAVWVVDSNRLKKACVTWGAHWRHLANTTEPSVCGSDAAFLSNYFNHLLVLMTDLAASMRTPCPRKSGNPRLNVRINDFYTSVSVKDWRMSLHRIAGPPESKFIKFSLYSGHKYWLARPPTQRNFVALQELC